MLEQQKVNALTGVMIDFKLRSRLFLSYSEASNAAHEDFNSKAEIIYPDKQEHLVSQFSVANPIILDQNSDVIEAMAEKFGGKYLSNWDDNCCSVIFFADNPESDDEINLDPNSWMFKYEILFSEDAIELSGNGDFVFSPMNVAHSQFTSSYH